MGGPKGVLDLEEKAIDGPLDSLKKKLGAGDLRKTFEERLLLIEGLHNHIVLTFAIFNTLKTDMFSKDERQLQSIKRIN